MIETRPQSNLASLLLVGLVVLAVAGLAFVAGSRAEPRLLAALLGALVLAVLLTRPQVGPYLLVGAALLLPLDIGTGTHVRLNLVTLLIPAVLAVWFISMIQRHQIRVLPSRLNRPLFLFLLANLLSLAIGNLTWDPGVPRGGNFLIVQLAQWALFAFSAIALWLTVHLVPGEFGLRTLTWFFLALGGGLAVLVYLWGLGRVVDVFATLALFRAPFWILLAGLAGGQLLFNSRLSLWVKCTLAALLALILINIFVDWREHSSYWVSLSAVMGTLVWLRWPRLRIPIVLVVVLLLMVEILFPAVYDFAGGDDEWTESGGSRLTLIGRVVEVTMRNPITGLGPAAYRSYASMTPLVYQRAVWYAPMVNSHNNFVDIFAHAGLLGLGLFIWFMVEVARLGFRLRNRLTTGFAAGYINGMLATMAGIVVAMLLLDWFLPFVYNVGFPGFQASVLVWLFLGGLIIYENLPATNAPIERQDPL